MESNYVVNYCCYKNIIAQLRRSNSEITKNNVSRNYYMPNYFSKPIEHCYNHLDNH